MFSFEYKGNKFAFQIAAALSESRSGIIDAATVVKVARENGPSESQENAFSTFDFVQYEFDLEWRLHYASPLCAHSPVLPAVISRAAFDQIPQTSP